MIHYTLWLTFRWMVLSQTRLDMRKKGWPANCLASIWHWVYASLWWRVRINDLCTKAVFVHNLCFKEELICLHSDAGMESLTKVDEPPTQQYFRRNCSAHTILSLKCRTREKLEESSEITLSDLRITPECSSCLAPLYFLVQTECKPKNTKKLTSFSNNKLPLMTSGRYVIHSTLGSTLYCPAYINNVPFLGHKVCTMWQI